MAEENNAGAFVELESEEAVKAAMGDRKHPYDVGIGDMGAMPRLIQTHPRIGRAFGALYAQIMFAPGHLNRPEREMVAGVASSAQDCFY